MNSILKQTIKFSLATVMALCFVTITQTHTNAGLIYSGGHCDLCVDYDNTNNSLELHYHFHDGSPGSTEEGSSLIGEIPPSELYTRVSDTTHTTTPDNSAYDFLGVPANSDVWILPQAQMNGVPFLGFGTEELDPADWSTDISYKLISVDGPGEFSLWMSAWNGSPELYFATSDGIDENDVYTQMTLSHAHANWGFTAEGIYKVQMQASGTLSNGTTLSTDVETFTFLVGSNTAVPEPGTFALLASTLVALCLMRRKKHQHHV